MNVGDREMFEKVIHLHGTKPPGHLLYFTVADVGHRKYGCLNERSGWDDMQACENWQDRFQQYVIPFMGEPYRAFEIAHTREEVMVALDECLQSYTLEGLGE